MSDTDDTDDLILIPPDFFLVQSEPDPPYYTIVDSLIKQVSNLQDRIEGIEHMSDVSLNSFVNPIVNNQMDLERKPNMFNQKQACGRRYYSHDDLYHPWSAQSSPQKPQEKNRINSLPNSPIINSRVAKKTSVKFNTPQKPLTSSASKREPIEETEVLHEIDTFISNVKTIQRNHAVRNLENAFNSMENKHKSTVSSRDLQKAGESLHYDRDVRKTIDEINQQSENLSKEIIDKNREETHEKVDKIVGWQCGDTIESVPNYNAGARGLLYNQKETNDYPLKHSVIQSNFQLPSTMSTNFNSATTTSFDKSSDSSSESTKLTSYNRPNKPAESSKLGERFIQQQNEQHVENDDERRKVENSDFFKFRSEFLHSPLHDNALSVLNMHKRLLDSSNLDTKDTKFQKKRGINTLSDNLALLNLADIWGSDPKSQNYAKLAQKVQEEKLRRQHCEHLIQELQSKNLELQQKLAVAIQVDQTKNQTLDQFRDALEVTSIKLRKLNEEKGLWELEVGRLKKQFSMELETAYEKIDYYEKEASRSLILAQENKDKISYLEQRCADLQSELQQIEIKVREVQESYEKEYDKNKQLADIISQKEIELKENKSVLNNAREEVSHSRKAVEVCHSELTVLKTECSLLQAELRDNKNTILSLTEQKKKLSNDIGIYKTNEKTLTEALEQSKHKLENTKVELRNFYQGQLELIVENKRKEMQNQLDAERQNSLEEIRRKELSMAKTAANHIKEISEKCALETKLLEQKHQEEIRLYQMQLSHKDKEIERLQGKLAHLPEKRAEIAKQLQKVMESQWDEALKMISGSSSPLSNDQSVATTITLPPKPQIAASGGKNVERAKQDTQPATEYDETPVSSRAAKQGEGEIQKYINMLLNRPPGNPVEDAKDNAISQSQQRAAWNAPVRQRRPK